MALGFLWSPVLFGNAWIKQIGMKKEKMSGGEPDDVCSYNFNSIGRSVCTCIAVNNLIVSQESVYLLDVMTIDFVAL